jgi:hypothetical protein
MGIHTQPPKITSRFIRDHWDVTNEEIDDYLNQGMSLVGIDRLLFDNAAIRD